MSIPTRAVPARAALVALLATSVPGILSAQALPPARDLVARYVEAIGGAEAVMATGSMHLVGTYSMPAMGLKGEIELHQMSPNRSLVRVNIEGLGEIRRGFDGTTGWSLNPMEGPRLLEGAELDQMRDDADRRTMIRDEALISSMETVEKAELNGQACYRVKIVWKSGRETRDCYAVDSGLLVATTLNVVSPMGTVESTSFFGEYRAFGAVRMPTLTRQQAMGQEQVTTVTSIEWGSVDATVFDPPAEIKALKK